MLIIRKDLAMEYRKKPVVVEAVQWNGQQSVDDLGEMDNGRKIVRLRDKLIIQTLEGEIRADLGDWIIKDKNEEISTCTPDTFATEYEADDSFGVDYAGEHAEQLCAALRKRPDLLGGLFMQIEQVLKDCIKHPGDLEAWQESIPFFLAMLDAIKHQSSEDLSSATFWQKELEHQLRATS